VTQWQLTTNDGVGKMMSQHGKDEWEVRAVVVLPRGEVKARGFGPTETDAKDCCLRNFVEELQRHDRPV
jgi:hypothetical protein